MRGPSENQTACTPPLALGFPSGSDSKESVCSAGDLGSIPGLGSSPGGGNGNPLQYSGLENAMDGGAWWTIVRGAAESATTEHGTLLAPEPQVGRGGALSPPSLLASLSLEGQRASGSEDRLWTQASGLQSWFCQRRVAWGKFLIC